MSQLKQQNWDRTYLQVARLFAAHSHDPILKVAAVVVDQANGSIVSVGINGRGRGRPNTRLSDEPGKSGCAHAEMNALARASWHSGASYTLYITHSPCPVCAALILNVPITRVVYDVAYRDTTGIEELRGGGIEAVEFPQVAAGIEVQHVE